MSTIDLELDRPGRSAAMVWLQRGSIVAVWLGAIVAWQVHQRSTGLSTLENAQRFIDVVGGSWWGVFAFVLVYLLRPIVLFPASVLTLVGGILFGAAIGVPVVIFAASGSAMVAYGVGRLLGRPPGERGATTDDASLTRRWAHRMREHSFETVLIMRLVFLPFDVVNYLGGMLRLRWLPFLLATAIGSFPGTVSFVLLGASLERVDEGVGGIDPVALVAGVMIFAVSIILARLIRRRQPTTGTTTTTTTEGMPT